MSACSAANCNRGRSASVTASIGRSVSGRLMPFPARRRVPLGDALVMRTTMLSAAVCSIAPAIFPSSKKTDWPIVAASKTAGSVQPIRATPDCPGRHGSLGVSDRVRTRRSPGRRVWNCGTDGRIPTAVRSPLHSRVHPVSRYVVSHATMSQLTLPTSVTSRRRFEPHASRSHISSPDRLRVSQAGSTGI